MLDGTMKILRDEGRLYRSPRGRVWRAYDHALARLGTSAAVPFRRRCVEVGLRGLTHPVAARVGTSDFTVVHQIFEESEYAPLLDLAPRDLRYVVDLGSNAGYSIRYWAENFPKCRILAAEPEPGNLAVCRRNIALGGIGDRVSVSGACVVGAKRFVELDVAGLEWSFRVARDGVAHGKIVEVPGITVSDIIAELPADAPIGLLKCDIEGSEEEVFKNSAPWIGRVRLAVVETHDPYTVDALLGDLSAAGGRFRMFHCSNASGGFPGVAFLRQAL